MRMAGMVSHSVFGLESLISHHRCSQNDRVKSVTVYGSMIDQYHLLCYNQYAKDVKVFRTGDSLECG